MWPFQNGRLLYTHNIAEQKREKIRTGLGAKIKLNAYLHLEDFCAIIWKQLVMRGAIIEFGRKKIQITISYTLTYCCCNNNAAQWLCLIFTKISLQRRVLYEAFSFRPLNEITILFLLAEAAKEK